MNIMQKRILEQNKPKVDTRPRTNFICTKWSEENRSGEIADGTGYRFGIVSDDLASECDDHLAPGERVSAVVDGPSVSNVIIESGPRAIGNIPAEREEFESVGASAGVTGWNPHLATPDRGKGTPHDGRFSHPRVQKDGAR